MTLLTLEHLQRLRLRQRSLPVIEDGPMFHSARGAAGQRDQARESAAEVRPPHVAAPSERLAALSARLRAANDSAAPANERADAAPAPRTAVARLQTLFNKGPEAPADREDEAVEEARPVSVRAPRRAPDSKPKSAPLGPCARCGGTGVVEGAVATFCSCPVGKAKHDRELALSWAPEEAKLIGALLDARAEQAPHAPVRSALLAASQHIQGAGYNRDGAAKVLRKEAARAEASAVRSELLAAADAIEAGDHLPPAPERDVADARAMAAHMIARATKLSPQDAAVIRAEAETIGRFALPRGMAGARLTRLARKVSRPLAAWLLDVASDIGIGAYDRAEAEPTASLGEPPVLAVEDAGPATRAHGNEAPASTLGSMSFDPAKLEATATTGGEASAEPANAEPAERNEVAPAAPAGDVVVEPPAPALPRGIRLWEDEGRVKVRFPARPEQNTPEAAVMEALKRAGFIWFKRGGAWTKRASEEARRQARAAIALAGEVEAGPVPTMVVLTREQAANRLVGVFKKHGLHSEVRTWARPWTVTAYYVDRVGPKKKPISQDLGSFYFAAAGGVGVAAVEAHLRDQRHLARALLESALAGVRVLSADEEAAGEKGTPDAPPPAPTSEVIEEITRDEAAARIAKALREAGLGPGVVVTIEQAKHRDGSAVLYVYARASAKRWRKLVEVSYGRFTLRRRGGVGLDAVRAEYGEREPQARIALERVLTGVRVLPMPGFEGPDGDEPPKGEPPAEPPAHAATVVSGPVVAGPPRDVYTLPDGGRLELGRALGAGLGAIAIHHPPAGGGRMESRDLVDGRVLAAPIVQRYAAAPEEDRLLFAALAARLGSTQAKADHEAALAVLPTPPPPLSKRSLQMGAWELEHDRNDQTITLRRAPRTGVIFTNEQDELGKLGLEIRTPTMARAPYSDALWAQLVAWLDQVATPSSAPEAPRLGRLTRHEAAEHVAQALRGHGYEARVIAPAGASGPVRVSATRDQIAGSIWLLLDGRLRIEPTRGAREAETAHELERIAAEALGGRAIEAAERAAAPVMVGPIELVQDEAGSWVARAPLEHDGETFPTRDEAERYARRIGAQRASRNVGSAPAANVPTTTGSDDGNTPVTFDFSGVRIARWHEGAPVVVLPFELRFEDGPRRGELHAWEEVDREARGHFRFLRGFINAEGERYGAHGYGASPPAWVRDAMTPLLNSYPVHAVDFDGARVEPTGGRMLVRLDAEPSEAVRRELRRGKFRRAADTSWAWERDRDQDDDAWWWARHVALRTQHERASARASDRVPGSFSGPLSHGLAEAAERIRTAHASLASSEQYARHDTRRLQRETTLDGQRRTVQGLLSQRDQLQELLRRYREDGSRRPLDEPAPELRDFREPLPSAPTRVARGIEIWQHGGRIHVRLAAEPSEWLADILHRQGFGRSRKQGEERTWWQASSPLALYWAHWLVEHEADKDENRPELAAERFTSALPADEPPAPRASKDERASSGTASKPPVVTMSMRLGERIVLLAEGGQEVATWEAAAQEALASENDAEREHTVRVVRSHVLEIERGHIVGDDWLDAFKRAWGSARRALLAARLFADQPIVVTAAGRAAGMRNNDLPRLTLESIEGVLPPGLTAAERQRTLHAIGDALLALGLVEREQFGSAFAFLAPNGVPAAWGWLLRHELRAKPRPEVPEAWALRDSLAARLLGYDAQTARWAMDTAYAEGWVDKVTHAATPFVVLAEGAAPPSSAEQRQSPAPRQESTGLGGMRAALGKLRDRLTKRESTARPPSEPDLKTESQSAAGTWVTGARIDRSGAAVYTHLIRAKDDPQRGDIRKLPEELRDRSAAWRRALATSSVAGWKWAIWQHLSDGVPRTFNRIGVELLDKTADVLLDLPPDRALWELVAEEKVEHTTEAPILFRTRAGAAPPQEPDATHADEVKDDEARAREEDDERERDVWSAPAAGSESGATTIDDYLARPLPAAYDPATRAIWAEDHPAYLRTLHFARHEQDLAAHYLGEPGRPFALPSAKVTPYAARALVERVLRAIQRVADPGVRRGLVAIALRVRGAFQGARGFDLLQGATEFNDVVAAALSDGDRIFEESRREAERVIADQRLGLDLLERAVAASSGARDQALWPVVARVGSGPDRIWTSDDALTEESRSLAERAMALWTATSDAPPAKPAAAGPSLLDRLASIFATGPVAGADEAVKSDVEHVDPPEEVSPASASAPAPAPALLSDAAPSPTERGGYRAWKFRLHQKAGDGFAQLSQDDRNKLAKLGGFDAKKWGFAFDTPVMAGTAGDQERLAHAFESAVSSLRVEPLDMSGAFAFGRTRGDESRDLPEVVDMWSNTLHGTRTLARSPDGARIVAVARPRLDWQAARWGGSWEPLDPAQAARDAFTVGDGANVRTVRRLSDGTWVSFGTSLSAGDLGTLEFHPDRESALHLAENAVAPRGQLPHPGAVTPQGPMRDRVRVVGWKDGSPEVELSLVLPPAYLGEEQELAVVVRGHVPSAVRRLRGETWRRIERVPIEVTPDSVPRSAEEALKRLVYEAIAQLPEEERERPKGRLRAAAPFAVGEHVRYLGPGRFGLETGSIGLVTFIRKPKEPAHDLSEITFPMGKVGRVEVVAAGSEAAEFERTNEPVELPDPIPEAARGDRHKLGVIAAQARGHVRLLEHREGSYRELAKHGDPGAAKNADAALRSLWAWQRVERLANAAAVSTAPEATEPAATEPEAEADPEPDPHAVAEYEAKREQRIEGLRAAGERRMDEAQALDNQARRMAAAIPFGQPILVGHHSERRDRNYRDKIHRKVDKSVALGREAATFFARAKAAESNDSISADEPAALQKLAAAIADERATHERMKATNAAARAGDREALRALGHAEAKIDALLKPDSAGRVGVPGYLLAYSLKEIQRLEGRAKEIRERQKAGLRAPEQYGPIEVREEENRVRIHFPAKPSDQDRDWLHRHGFKWAPSVKAWQRHASEAAWMYAREIAKRLGGAPVVETPAAENAAAAPVEDRA